MFVNFHFTHCILFFCTLALCSFVQSSCYTHKKHLAQVYDHQKRIQKQQRKLFFGSMKATRQNAAALDVAANAPSKTKNQQDFNWKKSLEVFTYLGLWYIFSGYYNIYNKRALTMLKLPW